MPAAILEEFLLSVLWLILPRSTFRSATRNQLIRVRAAAESIKRVLYRKKDLSCASMRTIGSKKSSKHYRTGIPRWKCESAARDVLNLQNSVGHGEHAQLPFTRAGVRKSPYAMNPLPRLFQRNSNSGVEASFYLPRPGCYTTFRARFYKLLG